MSPQEATELNDEYEALFLNLAAATTTIGFMPEAPKDVSQYTLKEVIEARDFAVYRNDSCLTDADVATVFLRLHKETKE